MYLEGASAARRMAVIDFLRATGFDEIDGEQVGDEWTVVATIGEPAIGAVDLDALVDEVERTALTLGVEFDGSSRSV